jgi:hypothetical protein
MQFKMLQRFCALVAVLGLLHHLVYHLTAFGSQYTYVLFG